MKRFASIEESLGVFCNKTCPTLRQVFSSDHTPHIEWSTFYRLLSSKGIPLRVFHFCMLKTICNRRLPFDFSVSAVPLNRANGPPLGCSLDIVTFSEEEVFQNFPFFGVFS